MFLLDHWGLFLNSTPDKSIQKQMQFLSIFWPVDTCTDDIFDINFYKKKHQENQTQSLKPRYDSVSSERQHQPHRTRKFPLQSVGKVVTNIVVRLWFRSKLIHVSLLTSWHCKERLFSLGDWNAAVVVAVVVVVGVVAGGGGGWGFHRFHPCLPCL